MQVNDGAICNKTGLVAMSTGHPRRHEMSRNETLHTQHIQD